MCNSALNFLIDPKVALRLFFFFLFYYQVLGIFVCLTLFCNFMLYYNVVERMRSVLFLLTRIYCVFFLSLTISSWHLEKNVYFLFHRDLEFVLHLLDYPCYISQIHYMLTPFCLKLCHVS